MQAFAEQLIWILYMLIIYSQKCMVQALYYPILAVRPHMNYTF